jgi:hypothetical protein
VSLPHFFAQSSIDIIAAPAHNDKNDTGVSVYDPWSDGGYHIGNSASTNNKKTGCQYRSDNALYFTLPLMPASTLAISTQWYITYIRKLEKRITSELGATVVRQPSRCGWFPLRSVVKAAVHRGEIQWFHAVAAGLHDGKLNTLSLSPSPGLKLTHLCSKYRETSQAD